MVNLIVHGTHEAARKALNEIIRRNGQLDNGIQRLAIGLSLFIPSPRLRQIARETIQNVSILSVRLGQALADPIKNIIVGREVPGGDGRLDPPPELRPARNMIPNDVPGGNMGNTVVSL